MKLKNVNIKKIACVGVVVTFLSPGSVLAKDYKIKKGDSLSKISLYEYGTTKYYDELALYNNIENPDFIRTNQIIQIPSLQQLLNYVYDEIYVVKKGDTLNKISKQKYGSSKYVEAVALYNNIENVNFIRTNQMLFLPNMNKIKMLLNNHKTNIYHIVKEGETLDYLSKIYYKTSEFASCLKEYNCLDSNYLKPNSYIYIPSLEQIIDFFNSYNEVKYVK